MDPQLQSALSDIRGSVEAILSQHRTLQRQVDGIDLKMADTLVGRPGLQPFETKLREIDAHEEK